MSQDPRDGDDAVRSMDGFQGWVSRCDSSDDDVRIWAETAAHDTRLIPGAAAWHMMQTAQKKYY